MVGEAAADIERRRREFAGRGPKRSTVGGVAQASCIEPGEDDWLGASATRFMALIAMHEGVETGEVVTWLNHVTDEEYNA